MQCPHNQVEIAAMHNELSEIGDGSWEHVQGYDRNILHMILGCELPDLEKDQCNVIWEITGNTVYNLYRKITSHREGVG